MVPLQGSICSAHPPWGEAETSSWAAGSLPAPARAVVSGHKCGCPLGHCNPTVTLWARCFEVARLETLNSAGSRDLPSAVPRIHPSLVHISTADCCLQPLEISSPWETQPKERGVDVRCLSFLLMHPAGMAPSTRGQGTQHPNCLLCWWHSAALGSGKGRRGRDPSCCRGDLSSNCMALEEGKGI